jgi:hypothetical protein
MTYMLIYLKLIIRILGEYCMMIDFAFKSQGTVMYVNVNFDV